MSAEGKMMNDELTPLGRLSKTLANHRYYTPAEFGQVVMTYVKPEEALSELARLQRIEAAAREALPTLDLAMEVSMKHEPCGYYCDEKVGHVDHKLFNWARETKGKLAAALNESESE